MHSTINEISNFLLLLLGNNNNNSFIHTGRGFTKSYVI